MLVTPVSAAEAPRLVQRDGHHALLVDGKPFLMLGAQAHNSSNYPKALGKVWAAAADAHANTVLMAVAWEQVEPVDGRFDFSFVDTLVKEARLNKQRLVLLWFATWKNTGGGYTPAWVKLNGKRFPSMLDRDGKANFCFSPFGEETLKADKRAFVALMAHLKKIDGDKRTVLMVQVENEAGTYGLVRDFAPAAQAAFEQPVPAGQWAQWAFEGRTRGAAEGDDRKPQSLELPGGWVAKLTYRQWQFWDLAWDSKAERPAGTEQPGGGVAIAQIGDDEFLIVGQRTRVRMEGGPEASGFMLHAEEGRFDDKGRWQMERVWNGDQVDSGLNLTAEPVMLIKVTMARTR